MLKRILIPLLIVFIILLSIPGCQNSNNSQETSDETIEVDTTESVKEDILEIPTTVALGYVRGKVITDSGYMIPSGIIVEDSNDNTYRALTNSLGGYNLKLEPGNYNLYFTLGPEYDVVKKTLSIESYKTLYLQDVRLLRLYDSYSQGWIAGDLHQHSYYSDGLDSVENIVLSDISVGLHYAFLSDHNTARGLAEWVQANHIETNFDVSGIPQYFNAFEAVEVTTEFGHFQSIGIGLTFDVYEVQLRDIERTKKSQEKDDLIKEKIIYIADTIRWAGGVPQINHPYSAGNLGFDYWECAEYFDTIEIWNGIYVPSDGRYESDLSSEQTQNYRSKLKWYELLNKVRDGSKFLPATGGTDNHSIASYYSAGYDLSSIETAEDYAELYDKSGKYSGVPTTYVYCPDSFDQSSVLSALRNGHSFISNGVIPIGTIGAVSYGDTYVLNDDTPILKLDVYCREGMEEIRIIKNGEAYISKTCDMKTRQYNFEIPLTDIETTDWIVIEAIGTGANYAITNPIFFE